MSPRETSIDRLDSIEMQEHNQRQEELKELEERKSKKEIKELEEEDEDVDEESFENTEKDVEKQGFVSQLSSIATNPDTIVLLIILLVSMHPGINLTFNNAVNLGGFTFVAKAFSVLFIYILFKYFV